jgi:hypothetical protein
VPCLLLTIKITWNSISSRLEQTFNEAVLKDLMGGRILENADNKNFGSSELSVLEMRKE